MLLACPNQIMSVVSQNDMDIQAFPPMESPWVPVQEAAMTR